VLIPGSAQAICRMLGKRAGEPPHRLTKKARKWLPSGACLEKLSAIDATVIPPLLD
jgi:hypothetical protein